VSVPPGTVVQPFGQSACTAPVLLGPAISPVLVTGGSVDGSDDGAVEDGDVSVGSELEAELGTGASEVSLVAAVGVSDGKSDIDRDGVSDKDGHGESDGEVCDDGSGVEDCDGHGHGESDAEVCDDGSGVEVCDGHAGVEDVDVDVDADAESDPGADDDA
jgi:hypothetical protein